MTVLDTCDQLKGAPNACEWFFKKDFNYFEYK